MEDEPAFVLPPLVSPATSSRSRFSKRRERKKLPRVFLIYDKARHRISGAFKVSRCDVLAQNRSQVHWKCDRVVSLEKDVQLEADNFCWLSTLVHLTPAAELAVRQGKAGLCGILNNHFSEVSDSRWHCWPMSEDMHHTFHASGGQPFTFASDARFAKAAGVDVETVGCDEG